MLTLCGLNFCIAKVVRNVELVEEVSLSSVSVPGVCKEEVGDETVVGNLRSLTFPDHIGRSYGPPHVSQ